MTDDERKDIERALSLGSVGHAQVLVLLAIEDRLADVATWLELIGRNL